MESELILSQFAPTESIEHVYGTFIVKHQIKRWHAWNAKDSTLVGNDL